MNSQSTFNNEKISCLVLACDSHIAKGNSVLHCLCSIFNQDYNNVEIILIENSHHKKDRNLRLLKLKTDEWNNGKSIPFEFKIINNKKSVNRGEARNQGVKKANGNILIFIDDDTIILDNRAFSKIARIAQKFDYGFGAKRLWTRENWFQHNSNFILKKLEQKKTSFLRKNSSLPLNNTREDNCNKNLFIKTFIANFGFCKKDKFCAIDGFPNFNGYGFEDDCVMFRLFKAGFKLVFLNNITVIHVNHKVPKSSERNIIYYFSELIKNNYYWFHVTKMFSGKRYKKSDILEPLKVLHYDYRIEQAYEDYLKLKPLNFKNEKQFKKNYWQHYYRFSKIELARQISRLQNSQCLDEFIKSSQADFDNVSLVVQIAIKNKFINIDKCCNIIKLFSFSFTQPYKLKLIRNHYVTEPDSKLNQFPCDYISRSKRFKFLKERYPFAEYLKFAIIGDDDLLSTQFINDYWAWPVIIEKDKRITNKLKQLTDRFEIIEADVRSIIKQNNLPKIQTFITDPPYTLHGSLSFIYAGLYMLENTDREKEFYIILNPTMMGRNMAKFQKILSSANIYLAETILNFSQYKLPLNYQERKQADSFLKSLKIKPKNLSYSSSSNLYIFKTFIPRLQTLRKQINFNKMYNHYI